MGNLSRGKMRAISNCEIRNAKTKRPIHDPGCMRHDKHRRYKVIRVTEAIAKSEMRKPTAGYQDTRRSAGNQELIDKLEPGVLIFWYSAS